MKYDITKSLETGVNMNKLKKIINYYKLADSLNIYDSYISKQTGLKQKEIRDVLDIGNNISPPENVNVEEILTILDKFFEEELIYNGYQKMDDESFNDILKNLKKEFKFKYSNFEKMIKENIQKAYDEDCFEKSCNLQTEFLSYQIDKYDFEYIMNKSEFLDNQVKKLNEARHEYELLDYILTFGYYEEIDEGITENVPLSLEVEEQYKQEHLSLKKQIEILETEINSIVNQENQDWKEYISKTKPNDNSCVDKYRIDKAIARTDRHKINSDTYSYNAIQQKIILETFFDMCTDDNGNALPDHFGTAIQLSEEINEKITIIGRWNSEHHYTKKVSFWANDDNINKYSFNSKLPYTSKNDVLYKFIKEHQRVFFNEKCKFSICEIFKILQDSNYEVNHKVFNMIADEFRLSFSQTPKIYEYYKVLSEYFDILSVQTPVCNPSKYTKEHIYRIVYEIASESNGSINFSNELVNNIYTHIHFKNKHWIYQMYLSFYYFKYNELESIINFIEKENKKDLSEKE